MSTSDMTMKAYEEKVNAHLKQAKAQLGEVEARAKDKMSQAQIDTINRLKKQHDEIEKKRQALKTVGEPKMAQAKAEIDSEMAKLKSSVSDLAIKLKLPKAG